ncbi:hypothetical protein ACOMHN_051096 [Nucella lapillus]
MQWVAVRTGVTMQWVAVRTGVTMQWVAVRTGVTMQWVAVRTGVTMQWVAVRTGQGVCGVCRIIRSTLYEAVPVVGMCDIYYALNGLLVTLQVLHVIWFVFILLIARDVMAHGQLKKDSRSSDESVSEEEGGSQPLDGKGRPLVEHNGLTPHRTPPRARNPLPTTASLQE